MASKEEPKPWLLRKQHWNPGEQERRIRLFPHDLENNAFFYDYAGAWVGDEGDWRLVISNRRDATDAVPDVVEYYAGQDAGDSLIVEDFRALTIVELHDFHRVAKNARNGRTFYDLEPCEGRWCRSCELKIPQVFGRQSHWSMTPAAADHLLNELGRVSRSCASCLTGAIQVVGLTCAACGTVIAGDDVVDPADQQVAAPCRTCGAVGLSTEVLRCTPSAQGPGCDAPRWLDSAATPWELELTVRAARSPRPFFDITAASPASAEIREQLLRPMNFDAFLGHMPLEEQARLLRRPNPFGPEDEKRLIAQLAQVRGMRRAA